MIEFEVGKALRTKDGPDLEKVEQSLAAQIARYLGSAIRERVQERGDLAGQRFPGWDPGPRGPKRVSAKYPDKAQGTIAKSGAEVFKTSLAYHTANQTQPGTYSTTGGMWRGLFAVVRNLWLSEVEFRGRSDGQDARIIGASWHSSAGKSKPLKVENKLKAWTVGKQHGVNVLLPNARELAAVSEVIGVSVAAAIGQGLEVQWRGEAPPKADLDAIFAKIFQARPLPTEGAV